MNIFDIIFLAVVVLFLIFGLFGRLTGKILSLIFTIVSLPLSWILSSLLATFGLDKTIINKLVESDVIKKIMDAVPSMESFLSGSSRVVLFYLVGIIMFILFGLLASIINKAAKDSKLYKTKAIISLGLINAITGLIVMGFLSMPLSLSKNLVNTVYTEMKDDENAKPNTIKILSFIDGNNETSILIKSETKLLEKGLVPFTTYKDGDKKYSVYTNLNDFAIIYPKIGEISSKAKAINTDVDINDSDALGKMVDDFGALLDSVDETRAELQDDSHIKVIVADTVEYLFTSLGDDMEKFSFLKNAKKYLNGFDYLNASYKEKLPSVIIQSYIDSIENENKFLVYTDISSLGFDDLKNEIMEIPSLVKVFSSQTYLSKNDVKHALTSSTIAKQIVAGLLDDYYTDDSINESNLDYDKESFAISIVLNYSNSEDNTLLDTAAMIEAITESDLLAAVLDFYQRNENPMTITLSELQRTAIYAGLDTKYAAGIITSQQLNTYKALFVTE